VNALPSPTQRERDRVRAGQSSYHRVVKLATLLTRAVLILSLAGVCPLGIDPAVASPTKAAAADAEDHLRPEGTLAVPSARPARTAHKPERATSVVPAATVAVDRTLALSASTEPRVVTPSLETNPRTPRPPPSR
jgi:hypothetical protein